MKKLYLILFLIILNVIASTVLKAETDPVALYNANVLQNSDIHGPQAICINQSYSYSVDTLPGATGYNWSVPSGANILSGQGTNSVIVQFALTAGDICVEVDFAASPSSNNCLTTFFASVRPSSPDTIYGPQNTVCPGQHITYSVDADSLTQEYHWLIPSHMTLISGQGTPTIEVSIDTNFVWGYLRAAKSNCLGISGQKVIAVYSAPSQPGSVFGPQVGACENGTYTYSFNPVPGATSYTWYAPNGCVITSAVTSGNPLTTSASSVDITFPAGFTYGKLFITSNSGCNSSDMRVMNIRSLPMKPGAIHGPFYGVCNQTGVKYFVDSVAGATSYTWTFSPSTYVTVYDDGNDTITVDYLPGYTQATLCVTANDACGSSISRCGVVFAQPKIADEISGPTGACNSIPASSIAYYEIDSVFGTSYYHWSVPPGASITAGQGTPQITVDYFGASSGNVSVVAENTCGNSPSRILSIVVNPCRLSNPTTEGAGSNVIAYPNPASTQFTVSFDATAGNYYSVRILDITGRIVLSRSHITNDGTNTEIFDVAEFTRGIYLVEVIRKNSREVIKMIVN
ncbi:MAG: T9SS type A sorting domain-containing protein [Bacteroidetes bacterium]|nr:T9SS type A sorting domain-containing protein [Bacteroidota bacterium]